MRRFWHNFVISLQITTLLVGSFFVMLGIPIVLVILTENPWWALIGLASLPLGFAILTTLWERIGDYH